MEESPYYEDALLHLEVDYPTFVKGLNELKRGITQLNDQIEHLQKDIKNKLKISSANLHLSHMTQLFHREQYM